VARLNDHGFHTTILPPKCLNQTAESLRLSDSYQKQELGAEPGRTQNWTLNWYCSRLSPIQIAEISAV
jgi:hypothetical protein